MMLASKDCWLKYGDPAKEKNMIVWAVSPELHQGVIPSKIYCNKDFQPFLEEALRNVVTRGLIGQLREWGGCFCIRAKVANSSMSLHSWGMAVDINASTNRFGHKPTLSSELVKCFTDAGLDWGGNWHMPNTDGMHFQMREFV